MDIKNNINTYYASVFFLYYLCDHKVRCFYKVRIFSTFFFRFHNLYFKNKNCIKNLNYDYDLYNKINVFYIVFDYLHMYIKKYCYL